LFFENETDKMGIGITCPFLAILKLNKKETPDIRHAQGAAR